MTKKERPYRPRDINQLAKYIVDLSVGEITEKDEKADKNSGVKKKKAKR